MRRFAAAAMGVVLLFVGVSVAQAAPSLVGYWPLDEGTGTTTADSSGNGNTGTLVNSPGWRAGHTGSGLNFVDTNTAVTLNSSTVYTDLYASGMTVMAWIKSIGGNSQSRLVDKDNGGKGWFFMLNDDATLEFDANNFATAAATRQSTPTIGFNTWQHVVATWDGSATGSNIHIYINGVLADGGVSNGSGAAQSDAALPLTFGNRAVDLALHLSGMLDDVRIYRRALTATEVQNVYNGITDVDAPTAPTSPGATAISSTQVDVSWTASTDNVGVTGYTVERCTGSTCTTFASVGTPTATNFSNTGLSASTTYRYRVSAHDSVPNTSTYSAIVNVTTPAAPDTQAPTAPTGLGATAVSSMQVNVSWTASTDNVGVTGYTVERCTGSTCTTFASVGTPTATTFSNTGLTASTTYRYRVSAHDAVPNTSAYSTIVNVTTPAPPDTQAPTAPTGLGATAVSSTQVNVSWTASTDNVGVTGYTVERCAGSTCTTFASVGTPTATTFSNTGLTASTTYRYRVSAHDAVPNTSAYSSIVNVTTPAAPDTQAPTTPTGLAGTVISSTQINLSWTASTDNVAVTGYKIKRCIGASCTTLSPSGTATTYNDTGLVASTTYTYSVQATDAAANLSSFSTTINKTTSAAIAPPTVLTVTAVSNQEIDLSWTASTSGGVTGYLIERCQGASCSSFAQVGTTGTTTVYYDPSLSANTSYSYRIRATTGTDTSTYSSVLTVSTLAAASCN